MTSMWTFFDVTIQIKNRICGGVPRSPQAIEGWIRANVDGDSRLEQLISETKDTMQVDALSEEEIEKLKQCCWNSFKTNADGPYIEGRQVKAMIKEAANIIKGPLDITAFKARVAERVFVREEELTLGTNAPHGSMEGVVHAMTPKGPISALKKVDYVERPAISFSIKALNEALVCKTNKHKRYRPDQYLAAIFEMGEELGLGADRSQGFGKFKVVAFEQKEA